MRSAYSDGKFYAINTRYNPFIDEVVSSFPVGKAIDFGCGIGTNIYNLMTLGWEVYAVDVEPLAVEKTRSVLPADHVFLSHIDAFDFSRIPNVDLILCNYVFQHLSFAEIERFVDKISLKSNPKGHFILSFFKHRGEADFEQTSSCFVKNGWEILKKKEWQREDLDHGKPHIHEGVECLWHRV